MAYRVCPDCGASLDPGEICDCQTDELRENNLTQRVAEARKLGISYGQYMAMLRDGAVEDPLAGGED